MRTISLVLCVYFLFVCQLSWPLNCSALFNSNSLGPRNQIDGIFRSSLNRPDIYEPGRCHENVYRFLKQLTPQELDGIRIIAIFPVDGKVSPMVQFNQRSKEQVNEFGISSNYHHVIFIKNQLVYDLSSKELRPEPVKEYFLKMFEIDSDTSLPSPHRKFDWRNDLIGREVPLKDYLATERSLFTYKWLHSANTPLQKIHELVHP